MKCYVLATLLGLGWLAGAVGCGAGHTATPLATAPVGDSTLDASVERDETWGRCQLVIASLEPAARSGRTSPVIMAHLTFVDMEQACRDELRQRAPEHETAEQTAFLELMLISSTHQAARAYAEEGRNEQSCNWIRDGVSRSAQWYASWGEHPVTDSPETVRRWTALRDVAARERMFFDLHLTEYCDS